MVKLLRILFIIVLIFTGHNVLCQDFATLHYTVEDGLPSNNVYHVYRDSKGFLWFTTDKGVARYNGIKFEVFNTFNGLPDNEIFMAQEDYQGRIWFGTYNGELCYYENGIFHTAANSPFLKLPFKTSHIINITREKDSTTTITFKDVSTFINIKNDYCKVFNLRTSPSFRERDWNAHSVLNVNKISADRYDLVSSKDITTIDSTGSLVSVRPANFSVDPLSNPLLTITHAQDETYITNSNYIFSPKVTLLALFKKNTGKYSYVYNIYKNYDYYFLCTNNGLFINDSIQALKGNRVSSITQDKSDNYWISTLDNGIYCINEQLNDHVIFNNTNNSIVKCSAYGNGRLYFATVDNVVYCLSNGSSECIFNYGAYNHAKIPYQINPAFFIDKRNKYYSFYNNENTIIDLVT